jgi:hypothetical protein
LHGQIPKSNKDITPAIIATQRLKFIGILKLPIVTGRWKIKRKA